jgi:photosystem I subunit 6
MYSFLALAGPAACLVFGGKGSKDAKLPITVGPQQTPPSAPATASKREARES